MLSINPDLINSCRVCRSPIQEGDYQCLFESGEHEAVVMLSKAGLLYEKLLDIPLNERNFYPQYLCNSCDLQMKLFSKLKDKALKTLEYLQSLYGEVVDSVEQSEETETLGNQLQNNEQLYAASEAQEHAGVLDDYTIKEYEAVYDENETDNKQIIDEEFTQTLIAETITDDNEKTNYSCQSLAIDYELDKLHVHNAYSQPNPLKETAQTCSAIETDLATESEVHVNSAEDSFFTKIEPDNYTIENSQTSEENFAIKLEPLLDKNDYVTEIYQLIDDESNSEDHNLNSKDVIDCDSNAEASTETSSTYNDIEYLVEEDMQDCEDNVYEGYKVNCGKRRRLNHGCGKGRIHTCRPCQLDFPNIQEYKLHRNELHNEELTNCSECSKEFSTSNALQRHIKIQHNQEPAFKCDICQKTFNQKAHYIYHMNCHNNIRNFKCDMCTKAFITKADLKTHQRTHTGERPYVCSVCGKDYLQMEHLKTHFITHTNQSFRCNFCNKQFATHKTLRLHVRTIHEDTARFKCTICLKPFRRKHHLEYHMKSHQQNNVNVKINAEIFNDNVEVLGEESVDDPGFICLP